MRKKLLAAVVVFAALSVTGCAQGRVAAATQTAESPDAGEVCASTTYFEHAPDSGARSRVDAVNGMIAALREHPEAPELEYASRADILLLLETSVDNLIAAERAAGEAAQANGYLEVPVETRDGEHLGQVNISEVNGGFVIDAIEVAHRDGISCPG
ncbi:hypothetical protein [Microbacterium hominis]|uniref:Lipoprotein n=1 Tax=Microbacterium hominis TaxID=162426 RepID=A0A7D4Q9T8_9MICO|nr:hypothetical protein [Microbacterium hominis]QKJ20759.1 hypothetical protein HQM25_16275 [Microbacterium hominis]